MRKKQTFIIAEAGVNHNGSLDMARRLIDAAAEAGADAVKFQTFKSDLIAARKAPKAAYQKRTTNISESQYEMLKKLELDENAHINLIRHSAARRIQFLSTPFDMDSLDLLVKTFNLPKIKISSGDITNAPLLLKAAQSGKPVILSTGMSTLAEIEMALSVLAFGYMGLQETPSAEGFRKAYCTAVGRQRVAKKVILLHCTSEYPAPFGDVHLRAMDTLKAAFGLPVGFSDHTEGIAVSIAAAARGAVVVEKHFTLDKTLPGPDHAASLDPAELKEMVSSIRQVEQALGESFKMPSKIETINSAVIRKSIVAMKEIRTGERFSTENLTVKRPGKGLSPLRYWELLGCTASKDYQPDDAVP